MAPTGDGAGTATTTPATGIGVQREIPTISANTLRFAGEVADSFREELASLVFDPATKELEVVPANEVGKNKEELLRIRTDFRGEGMRAPGLKVQLSLDGQTYDQGKIPNFNEADAVFLTQSAVAKFLLPYYMRFKSPAQVQNLENKLFNNADVIAAYHIPGSWTFPIMRVGVAKR